LGALGPEPLQVSVTCRSVRSHHKPLVLSGECRPARLAVTPMAAAFRLEAAPGVSAASLLKRRAGVAQAGAASGTAIQPAGAAALASAAAGPGTLATAPLFHVLRDDAGTGLYDLTRRQEYADGELVPALPRGNSAALTAPAVSWSLEVAVTSAADGPMEVALRSDSFYFSFTASSTTAAPGVPLVITVTPRLDAIAAHLDRLFRTLYVHEHLTVYDAARPDEAHRVVLSLRAGHMVAFQAFPRGPMRTTLATFEQRIGDFLAQFNNAAAAGGIDAVGAPDLALAYAYIVDELLEFGLLLRSSSDFLFNLQLANLLFTVLFQHPLFQPHMPSALPVLTPAVATRRWPPALERYVGKFFAFLQYFTNDSPTMQQLQRLFLRLVTLPGDAPRLSLGDEGAFELRHEREM
jgi:hypothetical protein